MKFNPNKRYIIYKGEFNVLYCKKKNGFIRIYEHIPEWKHDDYNDDVLWIEGDYKDLRLLLRYKYENEEPFCNENEEPFCYLILKDINDKGIIIELLNKKVILSGFQYDSYCGAKKRTIYRDYNEIEDVITIFINEKTNYFALYSIVDKFIFGPYNYKKIEKYQYGVKLDDKTVVDYLGYVTDITGYDYNGMIWYNKEKDAYLMEIDEEGSVFYEPEQDDEDEDILKVELENCIYTYNKQTEELDRTPINNDEHEIDWSDYADIAYEGYSRLELGLD